MRKKLLTNNGNIFLWVIWFIYIALIAFLCYKHELWLDEWHVWYMCKNLSLTQLLQAMSEEGHFCFWHMLNYPFVKCGCGLWCLQLMSCLLCTIGTWLLLFRSSFSVWCKVLILLSYPMIYAFPVLPRCYALIPPILFGIACLFKTLQNNKYMYCFFVGLLAHTHVYMEGLVLGLFLLYYYDFIYKPYKNKVLWKQNVGPALVIIFMVFLAFFQVRGSLDVRMEKMNSLNCTDTMTTLLSRFKYYYTNNSFSYQSYGKYCDYVVNSILGLTFVFSLYRCFFRNILQKKIILVGLMAIVYMIFFGLFIYRMSLQRILLPFYIIIFLLWIVDIRSRYKTVLVFSLFALTSISQSSVIYKDIVGVYCNGEKVAAYVDSNIPKQSIIAAGYRFDFIQELLQDKEYNIIDFNKEKGEISDTNIDEFYQTHSCPVFYPICMNEETYTGEKYDFQCLYNGNTDDIIHIYEFEDMRFFVYRIQQKIQKID